MMTSTLIASFGSYPHFHSAFGESKFLVRKISDQTCSRPRTNNYRLAHVRMAMDQARPFVIGLNQYSHDAGVAMVDHYNGQILYALSKERLTRHKHDGGDVGVVVEDGLQWLATTWNTTVEDLISTYLTSIVANNHHFRIRPFEARLPYQVSLNYLPSSYLSSFNLLHAQHKYELSHHLAHAFSAIASTPFNSGLAVVMDGMGDSLDEWLRYESDPFYFTEISSHSAHRVCVDHPTFRQFPSDVLHRPGMSYREAETVYLFEKHTNRIQLSRLFKRWTQENAPSELQNHSFEEMDSVGAMYSRVSSIIFKDWNNCGKVMGLAPYGKQRSATKPGSRNRTFMHGDLFDGSLDMTAGRTTGLRHLNESFEDSKDNAELRHYFENLASAVQSDLEDVVLSFVDELIGVTGEHNVVFCGGVAQNSCLNGKLSEHKSIDQFHVSPYPGDEGIAIGCAIFGANFSSYMQTRGLEASLTQQLAQPSTMPFFGRLYTENEFRLALSVYFPWVELIADKNVYQYAANGIINGDIVAWFSGRSEYGARALGHRSLLGRATHRDTRDYMNDVVKRRESFRPLAPAVLTEDSDKFFDISSSMNDCSKVMAVTCACTPSQRQEINGVVHVDGSARIQTVSMKDNEQFYKLIKAVEQKSNVPVVLNTSFNIAGEPIVESPLDAMRSLLTVPGISMLVMADVNWIVRKREFGSISEESEWFSACSEFRISVIQRSDGECVSIELTFWRKTFSQHDDEADGETAQHDESRVDVKEYVVELEDDLEFNVFQAVHNSDGCSIVEITREVCDGPDENGGGGGDQEGDQRKDVCERIARLFEKMVIYPNYGK